MKKYLLILLLVLSVLAFTSLGLAAAQENTKHKALVTELVRLYEAPDSTSAYRILAPGTVVTITNISEDEAWYEVEAPDKPVGYVMIGDVVQMNMPLLAPMMMVATNSAGAAGVFAEPDFGAEMLVSLPDGSVASVLAVDGAWAYVLLPDGTIGWSVASAWAPLPEGSKLALVTLGEAPAMGVFAEPNVSADLVTSVPADTALYILGAPEGEWAKVLLMDGSMGYALASSLNVLPSVRVDAQAGANAVPAVFAEPDFAADLLVELDNGTAVTWVSTVDDFWMEVYHPTFGLGYVLRDNFSNPYGVATVQTQDAIVRAGPHDALYKAVAVLNTGTKVIVKGISDNGDFVEVAIPISEIDYPRNGLGGWMLDRLFVSPQGASDLDTSFLAVTGSAE
jgi:hypothetical protein